MRNYFYKSCPFEPSSCSGCVAERKVPYNRFQKVWLALRIGYIKEASRLILGKSDNYIWEGTERNPMPF